MTVIYYMSIDRADKPWIGDRRLTESQIRKTFPRCHARCHYSTGQKTLGVISLASKKQEIRDNRFPYEKINL